MSEQWVHWTRRAPEFFHYWTYWLIVALACAGCSTVCYAVGGWTGAAIGAAVYVCYECLVVACSWQPPYVTRPDATQEESSSATG